MNRQQKIAELKAQIAELEKITPEQRFLELIDGMTVKIDKDKYPDSTFFFKGDKCYLELENSTLWGRYAEIWQVFEVEFHMNYQVEKHFRMRGATPCTSKFKPRPEMPQFPTDRVEQNFKI
jgi:hypothetical protein